MFISNHTSISDLHLHNRTQDIERNQIPAMFIHSLHSKMRLGR